MEQTFGERLKSYRKARQLTQQALAERIGVSDKTVSRWESEGGYPDVSVLVPLARALGVTVDDLLDGKRPVRSLTRADYQSLLSFAFALGGGVVYFLLDLFVPGVLCYLFYLACLAYGVYLQKYYAYQSRWFLLGEAVVDLFVNLSFSFNTLSGAWALGQYGLLAMSEDRLIQAVRLVQGGMGQLALLYVLVPVAALVLTGVTQYLVWKKGFEGNIPPEAVSRGHGEAGHRRFKLTLGAPRLRLLPAALVPVLAGLYWLPQMQSGLIGAGVLVPGRWQETVFAWLLAALGLLAGLPVMKRGRRRWLVPVWATAAVCWGMTGMRRYSLMWSTITNKLIPWSPEPLTTGLFHPVGVWTWGIALLGALLCAVWVALSCVRLEKKPEEPAESPAGGDRE